MFKLVMVLFENKTLLKVVFITLVCNTGTLVENVLLRIFREGDDTTDSFPPTEYSTVEILKRFFLEVILEEIFSFSDTTIVRSRPEVIQLGFVLVVGRGV